MKMREDIRPVSYLKSCTADLLKHLNETRRPVIITQNGEPRAVLQDPESYERTKSAIGLMKLLAQGEEDLLLGKTYKQENVFRRLAARLKASTAKGARKTKV